MVDAAHPLKSAFCLCLVSLMAAFILPRQQYPLKTRWIFKACAGCKANGVRGVPVPALTDGKGGCPIAEGGASFAPDEEIVQTDLRYPRVPLSSEFVCPKVGIMWTLLLWISPLKKITIDARVIKSGDDSCSDQGFVCTALRSWTRMLPPAREHLVPSGTIITCNSKKLRRS